MSQQLSYQEFTEKVSDLAVEQYINLYGSQKLCHDMMEKLYRQYASGTSTIEQCADSIVLDSAYWDGFI